MLTHKSNISATPVTPAYRAEAQAKLAAYRLKISIGKTSCPAGEHAAKLLEMNKQHCIVTPALTSKCPLGYSYQKGMNKGKRELSKQDNCVWYTDEFKKDTERGMGLFTARIRESISMNLSSLAATFQVEPYMCSNHLKREVPT